MRLNLRRLVLLAVPALILLLPASANAFPLTNCTLTLTSYDVNGNQLASATNGADDATQANPFVVDWDGTVAWTGTQGSQVITDHHWGVSVFNIPTPLSGGDPNAGHKTDGAGTVQVGKNLPFRLVGLFYVSGQISGTGGDCAGSGWMKLDGSPLGTIPFWVFVVLAVLGALLTVMGIRGSAAWAIIGGLFLGLGAALASILFALPLVGSWTPLAAIVAGLALGVVVAFLGPKPSSATG